MLKAIVKSNLDPCNRCEQNTELTVGEAIPVEEIWMGSFHTHVALKGHLGVFNSVMFEFEEDGKPIDIYSDPRFNPYIK